MNSRKRTLGSAAAFLVGLLALSACSGSGADDSSPIRIGAVSSITGPAPFPDVPAAAQAVFDQVNAEGGINGRQIEFVSEDDAADPALASQAARRLIDESSVVALAGSASLVDCSANAAIYGQRSVLSISGAGVDPACFQSPNIAPVNTGPFLSFETLLTYASDDLSLDKVCAIILTSPGITEGYKASVTSWEEASGKTAALVDTTVGAGDDPTPAILAAKEAGCDAVAFNSLESNVVSFMGTVQQQGMLETMTWLTVGSAYTDAAASALQQQGTLGLYANSEFLPFTSEDPALDDWRTTLEAADVPLTSLSLGGYLSAHYLVEVLRGIEGDITRESVTEALQSMEPIESALVGMPFVFGEESAHSPNRASQMVQATDGGWTVASGWIELQ